jgi:hypothetical protein
MDVERAYRNLTCYGPGGTGSLGPRLANQSVTPVTRPDPA